MKHHLYIDVYVNLYKCVKHGLYIHVCINIYTHMQNTAYVFVNIYIKTVFCTSPKVWKMCKTLFIYSCTYVSIYINAQNTMYQLTYTLKECFAHFPSIY